MKSALVLVMLSVALPALAHPRVTVRHHQFVRVDLHHRLAQGEPRHAQRSAWNVRRDPESQGSGYHPGGTVTVSTAAGPITVASDAADKFVSLTNDLVAHGFHGSVSCAATGHMPNSLHHTGHACDFAQTARNRTVGLMYHVADIIAAHGLRDGCSFGDCGHVDTGAPLEGHRFAAASSRHQAERVTFENRGVGPAERVAYQHRAGGQSGFASGYGTSFAPQQGSYVRTAARETNRAVVMRWPDRGAFARERFLEVGGGEVRSLGLAHHALVRRRFERARI